MTGQNTFIKRKSSKAYLLYRETPVGQALFLALEEMIALKHLTKEQALMVVAQYDFSVRKIIHEKGSNQLVNRGFSFQAGIRTFRWFRQSADHECCHVLFEDVCFYQHFRPKVIQSFLMTSPLHAHRKRAKKRDPRLAQKIQTHDILVLIERIPLMMMVSQSERFIAGFTKKQEPFAIDECLGKCKVEQWDQPHPRLVLYRLTPMREPITPDSQVENEIPEEPPMLNRFKNSTMFAQAPSTSQTGKTKLRYYSRQITQNPLAKPKHVYEDSFKHLKKKVFGKPNSDRS